MKTDKIFTQDITNKLQINACKATANTILPEKVVKALSRNHVLYGSMYSAHLNTGVAVINFERLNTKNPIEYEHYIKETYENIISAELGTEYLC